jgi:two-component system, OmpR family, phosphate regulon response regulator PhoB
MSKKVLIVDDDPDVRLITASVVEDKGYTAIEAVNGEEGLAKVKSEKPDLVVLDVMMPKQSGVRLFRNLKTNKNFQRIPVLMLTGIAKNAFLRSQKALTEFGDKPVPEPEGYLEKPVDPEALGDAIRKFLA